MTEEREIYQGENRQEEVCQGQTEQGESQGQEANQGANTESQNIASPPESKEFAREKHKPDYPPRVPNTRNFRRIQKLLFAYPGTNLAIKSLETQLRQIDNEMVRSGVANYNIGSGGSVSSNDIEVLSSTESDVEKRLRNKKRLADKINTLRARQEAIRAAVNQLGDAESRIIRTKYFQNWESKNPGARIWRELEMKWDTYLKRLTFGLEFVGRWTGEWNDKPVEKVEEKTEEPPHGTPRETKAESGD